ncbi:hypothetical protein GIB67_003329, partial [Kingdonia uniflora]
NMWEAITVCDHLYGKWENEGIVKRITPEVILQFYGVKNYKASGGGNCLQRDDEEPLDLLFRTLKQTSGTIRSSEGDGKEKWRRIKPLGRSRERITEEQFIVEDDLKAVEERAKLAAHHGEEDVSKMVARLIRGAWIKIEEEKSELEKGKIELEQKLAQSKVDVIKEENKLEALKASHVVAIGHLQSEARVTLVVVEAERKRLGRHLISKGYSEDKVDAIKADTYIEEGDNEEVEEVVMGVIDGLDGVSRRTVLDNQGDDTDLPEGDNEKVKLDLARSREDDVLQYNREIAKELDWMREANENKEDQHVKVHFKFVEATQDVFDLTYKVDEKDTKIGMGLKELAKITEHAAKLQSQVDTLMVDTLMVKASEAAAEHLHIALPTKDMEFWGMQRRCNELYERVESATKEQLAQSITRAKKAEAREYSRGSRNEVKAPLVQRDVVSLSGQIREMESIVSRIQGHVQRGNANLRECQHKLDVVLIWEKVFDGEIKSKKTLMKKKYDSLNDTSAREELNAEIVILRAQVVNLKVAAHNEST